MAPRMKRKYARKSKAKRGRRSAGARVLVRKNDMAKVSQVIKLSPDTSGIIYAIENVSLAAFDRAVQVARGFQFYRISRVKFTFKPRYDTWGTQLGTGSVPYLYYRIDKGYNTNGVQLNSFNSMRDTGAIARRFDDHNITVTWKLCVAVSVGDLQGPTPTQVFSMVKTSPWLNTNGNSSSATLPWVASGIDHRGIAYGVEQEVLQAGPQNYQYDVLIEAFFEFKDPLPTTPAPSIIPYVVKDIEQPGAIV